MYTSASLLNYGLLSVGKYVIKDELDLVLYHPGAPSLVRETDTHIYIYINNLKTWHTIIVQYYSNNNKHLRKGYHGPGTALNPARL